MSLLPSTLLPPRPPVIFYGNGSGKGEKEEEKGPGIGRKEEASSLLFFLSYISVHSSTILLAMSHFPSPLPFSFHFQGCLLLLLPFASHFPLEETEPFCGLGREGGVQGREHKTNRQKNKREENSPNFMEGKISVCSLKGRLL